MLQGAGRNLLPYFTPLENVRFAQGAARAAGKDAARPGDVLAGVGLEAEADRPLGELTPGHLQLAALAVAMAPRPGLLLADEPTSQLEHERPRPGAGLDARSSTASSAPRSCS